MEGVYPAVSPYSLLPLILSLFSILGDLLEAIERDFGSFDIFRAEMTAKTIGIEGSGWGWLVSHCRHTYLCRQSSLSFLGQFENSVSLS